jgi:tetratricopeptide (TPR) repeat protein
VGVLMLLPIALYGALGATAARRFVRRPADPENLLLGALLLFGLAGLPQSWYPMLLLRLLQSALPFYLGATIAIYELGRRFAPRRPHAASAALALLGVAACTHLWLVLFRIPIEQPLYTGSMRSRHYGEPVQILGETFYERWNTVEEIRLLRAFFAANTAPDEPTLGLPTLSLYNPILERPNPTRFLAEHPKGNFVMSAAQKRDEGARLLASGARFVIVGQDWYARGSGDDPLLSLLRTAFHPVRGYRSVLILARGSDPAWAAAGKRIRRTIARGPDPADIEAWRAFSETHPDEPIAWRMLAAHQTAAGNGADAIESLYRAAHLDPGEALPLVIAAQMHLERGDRAAARADLERARAIRESPEIRRLTRLLDEP